MRLPTWITPTRALLFAILIAGMALRLSHLGAWPPGLYPDEATNGNDAISALHGHLSWFYPNNNGREGLFINLQALALLIIGLREPWVLRLVSAIVGICTIPGIYLLGKELWNKRVGLIASALLAGSFWHVLFSRIGFRAIMAPLVLTYALYFLLLGIRKIKTSEQYAWGYTALGGALAGLGFHTYIAFRAAALVFVVTSLALIGTAATEVRKRVMLGVSLAAVSALIVAAPLLYYFYVHPGSFSDRSVQVSVLSNPHPIQEIGKNIGLEAGMFFSTGDGNWRHNDAGQPAIPLVLFIFLIGGIAYTGHRLITQHGKDVPGITVLMLIIAGGLPAVISDEGLPHALRSIMLIVPTMLLIACGVERAWHRLERNNLGTVGSMFAVIICGYSLLFTATRYPAYAIRPEVRDAFSTNYLQAGRDLLRRDLTKSAYVVIPHGDVLIDGLPVAGQTPMFISGTATRAQQEQQRIYYVTSTDNIPHNADVYDLR